MNKLRSQKNRKHLITLVCLLVGMLVLTSAVYANSDDAKGYTNFKNALKQLAFYEDNYTLEGSVDLAFDDKSFSATEMAFTQDKNNSSTLTKNRDSVFSSETYLVDGTYYTYYPKTNTYSTYESGNSEGNRLDITDPMVKKTVNFIELLGDTVVGDLKNNVVYVGGEGGAKDYTVNISGTQIPEVVNAGLSLMMGTVNNDYNMPDAYVSYQDYLAALSAYYEKETGKQFDDEAYNTGELDTEEMEIAMRTYYEDILAEKGDKGFLFVEADGSHNYYGTYDEFINSQPGAVNTSKIIEDLGGNPYIDSVHCDFSIDKDGNLSAISLKAVMAGKDDAGEKHTASMEIKGTATNFGTSKVELPDLSNAKKL